MEDIAQLRQELAESKSMLEAHENLIKTLNEDKEGLETKRTDLETRLTTLEMEYEELLDKTIAEEEEAFNRNTDIAETISELKVRSEKYDIAAIYIAHTFVGPMDVISHAHRFSTLFCVPPLGQA
jgi:kinesin family protein 5